MVQNREDYHTEVWVQRTLYDNAGQVAQNTDRICFYCSFLATGDSYWPTDLE